MLIGYYSINILLYSLLVVDYYLESVLFYPFIDRAILNYFTDTCFY